MEIVLVFLFAVAFGYGAWRNIRLAVFGIIVLLPTYGIRFALGSLPFTLLEVMILVVSGITLFRNRRSVVGFFRRLATRSFWHTVVREGIFKHRLLAVAGVAVAGIILSATVSVLVAPSLGVALGMWRAYFIEPVMFAAVLLTVIKTTNDTKAVLWACTISAVLIALVAVYQKITGWQIPAPWDLERRATSVYPYPNAIGLYVAPIIMTTLGLLLSYTSRWAAKWHRFVLVPLLGGAVALMTLSIFFSKTEAAIVALVTGAVVWGICAGRRIRMVTLYGVGVGLFMIIAVNPLYDLVHEKLLLRDWSGYVRRTVWSESIPMLQDHWLTGAGLGGYKAVFAPYHHTTFIEIFMYPHNVVLNFWSEVGLYGLLSFLCMYGVVGIMGVVVLRRLCTLDTEDAFRMRCFLFGTLMGLLVLTVHGLVDVPYFKNDLAVQWWVFVTLMVAWYRMSSTPSHAETSSQKIPNY